MCLFHFVDKGTLYATNIGVSFRKSALLTEDFQWFLRK